MNVARQEGLAVNEASMKALVEVTTASHSEHALAKRHHTKAALVDDRYAAVATHMLCWSYILAHDSCMLGRARMATCGYCWGSCRWCG
jgi:hypothetical protein